MSVPVSRYRAVGHGAQVIYPVGLGCMGMSWAYASGTRDEHASQAVIREMIDRGPAMLDTASLYGDGHNEELVGRALDSTSGAFVATKGGLVVDDLATMSLHRDGRPDTLRRQIDASLSRLGVEAIDLYYLHRVDPEVALEESWGALADAVSEGKVLRLGLSEVTVDEAERANALHAVSAIQSEFSLWTRDPVSGQGGDVVAWTAQNGATFVPFAPLGRGFLTGALRSRATLHKDDFRRRIPRFADAALLANSTIADTVVDVATVAGCSPAQAALAWVLAQGKHIIPIPGTTSLGHLAENLGAAEVWLSIESLARLTAIEPPAEERY